MSALKTAIGSSFTQIYTHPSLRRARRARAAWWRTLTGAPAQVHYFHQADDPYSHLCAQVLGRLAAAVSQGFGCGLCPLRLAFGLVVPQTPTPTGGQTC